MPTAFDPRPSQATLFAGRRIGLLGGSFNPPHAGHRGISLLALRRLHLDEVWWLVTPQNPLKYKQKTAALTTRMALCRAIARHPKLRICSIEQYFGTSRTYDTIKQLQQHFPATQFVWLMGSDNAQQFRRWYRWQNLLTLIPMAIISRPPRAQALRRTIFSTHTAQHWCWLRQKFYQQSSTAIRKGTHA